MSPLFSRCERGILAPARSVERDAVSQVPFQLRYTLSRRQRLAVELAPWLPCLAASLGFTVAVTYLAAVVSGTFLLLLPLPALLSRRFLVFLLDLAACPARPVDVLVEADRIGVLVGDERQWLSLVGIFQVYRTENGTAWIVLHLNGSMLMIPASAISPDQLDYLKGFARRAAAQRRAVAGSSTQEPFSPSPARGE